MATSRKKQRYTPQQRQEYVEQFGRSGLTQAEFCRRAKLHPVTFSQWRRKPAARAAAFAEVQVSTSAPTPTPTTYDLPLPATATPVSGGAAILHLRNGTKLELVLGDEPAWTGLGLMLKTFQA